MSILNEVREIWTNTTTELRATIAAETEEKLHNAMKSVAETVLGATEKDTGARYDRLMGLAERHQLFNNGDNHGSFGTKPYFERLPKNVRDKSKAFSALSFFCVDQLVTAVFDARRAREDAQKAHMRAIDQAAAKPTAPSSPSAAVARFYLQGRGPAVTLSVNAFLLGQVLEDVIQKDPMFLQAALAEGRALASIHAFHASRGKALPWAETPKAFLERRVEELLSLLPADADRSRLLELARAHSGVIGTSFGTVTGQIVKDLTATERDQLRLCLLGSACIAYLSTTFVPWSRPYQGSHVFKTPFVHAENLLSGFGVRASQLRTREEFNVLVDGEFLTPLLHVGEGLRSKEIFNTSKDVADTAAKIMRAVNFAESRKAEAEEAKKAEPKVELHSEVVTQPVETASATVVVNAPNLFPPQDQKKAAQDLSEARRALVGETASDLVRQQLRADFEERTKLAEMASKLREAAVTATSTWGTQGEPVGKASDAHTAALAAAKKDSDVITAKRKALYQRVLSGLDYAQQDIVVTEAAFHMFRRLGLDAGTELALLEQKSRAKRESERQELVAKQAAEWTAQTKLEDERKAQLKAFMDDPELIDEDPTDDEGAEPDPKEEEPRPVVAGDFPGPRELPAYRVGGEPGTFSLRGLEVGDELRVPPHLLRHHRRPCPGRRFFLPSGVPVLVAAGLLPALRVGRNGRAVPLDRRGPDRVLAGREGSTAVRAESLQKLALHRPTGRAVGAGVPRRVRRAHGLSAARGRVVDKLRTMVTAHLRSGKEVSFYQDGCLGDVQASFATHVRVPGTFIRVTGPARCFTIRAEEIEYVSYDPALPGGLKCSFCGKGHKELKKLIAGPTAYICDECVGLAAELCDLLPNTSPDEEDPSVAGPAP